MHKSRLAGFIIDCQTEDLDGAAGFWSAALGMERRALPGAEGEKYAQLLDPQNRLHVEVQTWVVMEAPTGQRFCVVRKASRDFEVTAKQWP